MASIVEPYPQSLISFLESHVGACEVRGSHGELGCTEEAFVRWEARNQPHKLPQDLKDFLSECDGVRLTWSASFRGRITPMGRVCVNSLEQLTRLTLDEWPPDDRDPDRTLSMYSAAAVTADELPHPAAGFDLDAGCVNGRVALLYFPNAPPQVWFQDVSCTWNYLAPNFSEYYRAMVRHYGVINWQMAASEVGLDPTTAQWINFVASAGGMPSPLEDDDEDQGRPEPLEPPPVAGARGTSGSRGVVSAQGGGNGGGPSTGAPGLPTPKPPPEPRPGTSSTRLMRG